MEQLLRGLVRSYSTRVAADLWSCCSKNSSAVAAWRALKGDGKHIFQRNSKSLSTAAEAIVADSTSSSEQANDSGVTEQEGERVWTPQSRRTGLIALKLGMTHMWDKNGDPMAVTALHILDNQVVTVRTMERDGYHAVQVGAVNHPKQWKMRSADRTVFLRLEIPPKRKLGEFRVTPDAVIPVGTPLVAAHFVPGQYVDVCATSVGKGFQGVMRRHGMKGQPASHGVTKTHRKMGATGGGGDPGRVWPGKRMAGRMGATRVTISSLLVCRVNNRFNVIYVKGVVPGHDDVYVRVTDAKRKIHEAPPPFPTFLDDPTTSLAEEMYADKYVHMPHEASLDFPGTGDAEKK